MSERSDFMVRKNVRQLITGIEPAGAGLVRAGPKENRWARLRSVSLACVRHFADLSRS